MFDWKNESNAASRPSTNGAATVQTMTFLIIYSGKIAAANLGTSRGGAVSESIKWHDQEDDKERNRGGGCKPLLAGAIEHLANQYTLDLDELRLIDSSGPPGVVWV